MCENILLSDSCIITSPFLSKTVLLMEIEINKREEILLVCCKSFLLLLLKVLPDFKQIEHNLPKKRQWKACAERV